MTQQFTASTGHRIAIIEPESADPCPAVYIHADAGEGEGIHSRTKGTRYTLVSIGGVDWNHDLTPWPATSVFKNGGDFSGGADAHLKALAGIIVPETEAHMRRYPTERAIAGYSLGGLFALYALYHTDLFSMSCSVSGSYWYDNWIDFMRANTPDVKRPKVYLSLGDKEKNTANARMTAVEECAREAEAILRAQGANVVFELNPGNHFTDTEERIAKGIRWLLCIAC